MSMIKCPGCGKEFSDKAPSCPNCGCPTVENVNAENQDMEKGVIRCEMHWCNFVLPACLFLICLGCMISRSSLGATIFLILAVATFIDVFLQYKFTILEMTGTSVTGKIGIINTKTLVSPINKVQDVSVSSGLIGKIFKYSTVSINTAGTAGTEYVFKRVTNGYVFQKEFVSRSN